MTAWFDTIAIRLHALALLFLTVFLVSCSGSSGSTQVAEGGISGTGIDTGSVSRFSSVVVNGVVIDIDAQTQIFVDQQSATESDLRVGYVLRVETDFASNTAIRIDYTETVRGPIVAVPVFNPDTLDGSFQLLGQNVITNSITTLDGVDDLSTLNPGDVLDISGVRDANGTIVARYVGLLTPAVSEYRVVGTTTNTGATTFRIGNLTIDYSAADTSQIAGGIVDGIAVRVRGSASGFNPALNSFNATQVTPDLTHVSAEPGIPIRMEGAITRFLSIADFDVRDLAVDASSASIENGVAADLQLNLLVQIEGSIDAAGTIIATRVRIVPLANIRIESTVDSVDVANNSLVIQGVTFLVDANTEFEDDSTAQITQFSLADLNPGDWVEIRAYQTSGNNIITKLERDDFDPEVRIQAPVDSGGVNVPAATVSLLGITIFTDAGTEFEDENDLPISQATFFATVMDGDLVKAKWDVFTSTTVPADELSLED